MAILKICGLGLAGLLGAAFIVARFSSATIATEIEISAPREAVWSVLSHTDGHSDWNPFITSFSGDLQVGNQLSITLAPPGGSPTQIEPIVLVVIEGRELRWRGHVGFAGLFTGEHAFVLEETDRGTTRLLHSERFSGLLVHPVMALMGDSTKAGFSAMNAALKRRVEARSLSQAQTEA